MKGNQLWDKAQSSLNATINTQFRFPDSRFHVIPFGSVDPLEVMSFDKESFKSADLTKRCDAVMAASTQTHISPALERGFELCDPNLDNQVYLFTDGLPNGQDSPEKVAATIKKWCDKLRNTTIFYVALKGNVVNETIRGASAACPGLIIIELPDGSDVVPQIVGLYSTLNPNIEELEGDYRISTGIPDGFDVKITSEDPYFDVKQVGAIDGRGDMKIKFVARNGLSASELHQALAGQTTNGIYPVRFRVESADKNFCIANPNVVAAMADHIQSSLTIFNGDDEADMGKCKWHDSFLWSSASEPGKVSIDLAPRFKNMVDQAGYVNFLLLPADDQKHDFTLYFNGQEVAEDEAIKIEQGKPAVLTVIFDTDAKTGTRHFQLVPRDSRSVDLLNGRPLADASDPASAPSLRAEYSTKWNPLKTILFWLGIVLLGLLVLWFLVLKRMIYPTIKASRFELQGPDGLYLGKKIKGNRKVVISSKKQKQNPINQLFTGKILYVQAEPFTEGLILEPGTRKKVRISNMTGSAEAGWDFEMGILSPYEATKLVNRADHSKKATLEIQ